MAGRSIFAKTFQTNSWETPLIFKLRFDETWRTATSSRSCQLCYNMADIKFYGASASIGP